MANIAKSIFQEAWWLDITAKKNWREVSHTTKYGDVKFSFAYRKRYKFFNEIYSPPLTPYTGFYFDLDKEIDEITKYKVLNEAVPKLLEQLPKYLRLKLNCLPSFDWWSPLYWNGFSQHTRYTSILSDIKNHDAIWKGFSKNTKRNIKKAQKTIEVKKCFDGERLFDLFNSTMQNQGRRPGYPKKVLVDLCKQVESKGCGQVLIGEDQDGLAHAGLLLVWDAHTAYYLVGGSAPSVRDSGAMPFTMWTAIQQASEKVDRYDFEGSMQKGIDRFVRSFGAIPTPYSSISDGFMANKIVRQKVPTA